MTMINKEKEKTAAILSILSSINHVLTNQYTNHTIDRLSLLPKTNTITWMAIKIAEISK